MDSLPNELLLEICRHLRPAKLLSRYPDYRDVCDVGIPIADSFAAYAALCLVSKRLNNIATPQLYANVVTQEPSARSIRQLFEFMEVVMRKPSLGQHVRYISHEFRRDYEDGEFARYFKGVRWLEHRRRMEKVASSIWQPRLFRQWVELFEDHPEQAQIVLLLALAPNVSRVFVDILEPAVSTVASLLDLDGAMQGNQRSKIHCFERLEILGYVSRPARELYGSPTFEHGRHPFELILRSLQGFPKLRYYQHANAGYCDAKYVPVGNLGTQLQNLETIKLHSCNLSVGLVALMVRSCTALKSFDFSLGEDADTCEFFQLHPALLRHKETLMRIDISFESCGPMLHHTPIGSFSKFDSLSHLRVPDTVLLGIPDDYGPYRFEEYQWTTHKPARSLIELLPSSLTVLILSSDTTQFSDSTEFLWDFVNEIERLPRLRQFNPNTRCGPAWCTELTKEMSAHGVQFGPPLP